jgi:Zn-dependent protease
MSLCYSSGIPSCSLVVHPSRAHLAYHSHYALAARTVGGTASSILLWPLGGLAFISHQSGPKADIPMMLIWMGLLALASHSCTGIASVSLFPIPYPSTPSSFFVALSQLALFINTCLLLFNLFVPAYPLDGGRILVNILILGGLTPSTTSKIVISITV